MMYTIDNLTFFFFSFRSFFFFFFFGLQDLHQSLKCSHPQRRDLTTSMVGLENCRLRKNLTKKMNPGDLAGNAEEEKK